MERLNKVKDLTDGYTGTLIVCRLTMEQEEAEEVEEMDGEAKRGITYQVQQNCRRETALFGLCSKHSDFLQSRHEKPQMLHIFYSGV